MPITLEQDLILKSLDGELMIVDTLDRNLETLATRNWKVEDFQKQIDSSNIIEFKEDEISGE